MRRPRRWTVPRVAAALLLAAFALLLAPGTADAHGALVSTEPAPGAVVRTLDRIVLRFAEPVETTGAHLWLESDDGVIPLTATAHLDGDARTVAAAVPPVASGRYTVGYHLVGDDGDVVTGSFAFTFDAPPAPGVASEPLAPPTPTGDVPSSATAHTGHDTDLAAGAARVLLDAALASLVGGLAFIAAVWPDGAAFARARHLLWVAAIAAALASFGLAVVQHAAAADLGIVRALVPRHLWQSLQFRFGRVAAARMVLLSVAALLTRRLGSSGGTSTTSRSWRAAACAVAIGLFETVALLGHTGRAGTLAEAARFLHALGVSVWLGGLMMLLVVVLPRRRSDELVVVLPRFSTLATVAVGALVLAGVALSIDLVGAAHALPTTPYGRVLLLKVVVVGALLAVAGRTRGNVRRRLVHATSRRRQVALAGAVTSWLAVELGLIVVVLGLTALLVSQAPPG